MEKQRTLVWDVRALMQFEKTLIWIHESSIQQAEYVEKAILEKLEVIKMYPERFPLDKFKIANSGNYRAFEIHNFRVSYHHTDSTIRILRFKHVRQNPELH